MDLIKYENNSIDQNNDIKDQVITTLAKQTNNSLGISLREILLHSNSHAYEDEIINILADYNFNIYDFYNETLIDIATENNLDINHLIKGLFIKNIKKDGLFVSMSTINETFRFALLAEYIKDKMLLQAKKNYELVCDCHKHTTYLLETKGLTAVTALCKMDFGGYYLHSYNICERTNQVWDASHNMIMNQDQYNKLFNPIIISKVTKEEYFATKEYKDYDENKDFPIFTLALKKAKKIGDISV
ncbi:MAG: hypothetical protein IJO33_04995 [Bacilli bacterium]|nr:hypothetical protein [Bacilli bacterium]